jgi:hypothetical protein
MKRKTTSNNKKEKKDRALTTRNVPQVPEVHPKAFSCRSTKKTNRGENML